MAVAYSIKNRGSAGDLFFRIVDLTLDNAYPAGGWALTAKDLGFGTNGVVLAVIPLSDVGGYTVSWDRATNKLMVRDASGVANAATPEITTVTLMNAKVVRVMAFGYGTG